MVTCWPSGHRSPVADAVARSFEREHGCTELEWLRSLPGAVGRHDLSIPETAPSSAVVRLADGGELQLEWRVLPERRIALIRLPRLWVRYTFSSAVTDAARAEFLRLFDLHMRRGGG